MRRLLPVIALAALLGGCDSQITFNTNGNDAVSCSGCAHVTGSGVLRVEERQVATFTAIENSNAGVIYITQGETETLSIESDDNVLPVLMSEVRDGVLRLSTQRGKGYSVKKLVYRITVRNLERVESRGSATIDIRDVTGQRLDVGLSGTGALTATGKVAELNLRISGTSNVDARALLVERADVSLSGTGSARLAVNREIDARISGIGNVSYSGAARVRSKITGIGSITRI